MNQDGNGKRKLFWKEVGEVNGGKMMSCNRIKDRNWRLALRQVEGVF